MKMRCGIQEGGRQAGAGGLPAQVERRRKDVHLRPVPQALAFAARSSKAFDRGSLTCSAQAPRAISLHVPRAPGARLKIEAGS